MYKNAELKDWKEAAHRMIEGEVFYYRRGRELSCDTADDGEVMFIESHSEYVESIIDLWGEVESWEVKAAWEDGLKDEPVLCWLSDYSKETTSRAGYIVEIKSDCDLSYVAQNGEQWRYARPVNPDECLKED